MPKRGSKRKLEIGAKRQRVMACEGMADQDQKPRGDKCITTKRIGLGSDNKLHHQPQKKALNI
jgi:hypothetical protein